MFTGHPKGLFRLFFIEMWERLAFYTMVGILLLYAGLMWEHFGANTMIYGLLAVVAVFGVCAAMVRRATANIRPRWNRLLSPGWLQ